MFEVAIVKQAEEDANVLIINTAISTCAQHSILFLFHRWRRRRPDSSTNRDQRQLRTLCFFPHL